MQPEKPGRSPPRQPTQRSCLKEDAYQQRYFELQSSSTAGTWLRAKLQASFQVTAESLLRCGRIRECQRMGGCAVSSQAAGSRRRHLHRSSALPCATDPLFQALLAPIR